MDRKRVKDKQEWYQLDLSGIVYPTLQRKDFSSVYRISILLKEKIDPALLQQAIDQTLKRFPTFKVAIHRGLFWRYLEPNHNPGPFLQPDIANPCMPMPFNSNNRYLIRFYYFDKRISLEAFHSVADGNGGLCLLKTVTAVYLRLKGHTIPNEQGVLDIEEPPKPEEMEDAYLKYGYSKIHSPRNQKKAYRLRGTKEPFYTLNVICGVIPVDAALKVAKSYNATLTEYLNAVLLYALMQKQKSENVAWEKPLKLAMPVDLRRFFPSVTLRNFITMIYPFIDPMYGEYTFEEIVREVHAFMRYTINEKFLRADISTNVSTRQNPVIRAMPLFVKDFVVRQFYIRVQDKQSSAGLTNLGKITLPRGMEDLVERFDVYMGQPFSARTNCAIISYQNKLTINFTSSIVEADVEKYFFRKLIKDQIPVKIETNRNMEVR